MNEKKKKHLRWTWTPVTTLGLAWMLTLGLATRQRLAWRWRQLESVRKWTLRWMAALASWTDRGLQISPPIISHTEVVIDLEDIETGGGLRVGNENALDRNIVRGIV